MVKKSVAQAKTQLLALVDLVLKGKEIVITRDGKPVARLVPYGKLPAKQPRAAKAKSQFAPMFDAVSDSYLGF
jgi:prevent-host-death family protein